MSNESHMEEAAKAYKTHTGFAPIHFDQSVGESPEVRFAALKQDLRWFNDYANEAHRFVDKHLCKVDFDSA